ncbi:WD40 repeat-like protein [Ascobolus immersus RN42]|uniref:WD40 repeat-like protein n=1 Tax=Ascobolus immersus RN42 TaxID=1160509 RepID=A0A3N4IX51_ASCIM|nr:WD40 repeat-like protein [Ascobolus immersus RN42]
MASPLFAPFSKSSAPNLRVPPTLSPGFTTPSRASSRSTAYTHKRTSSGSAENGLFLRRVIGCSTTAFASHAPSRSFAYTAGAAAVVVQLDEDLEFTQRFFRARPNAPTISVPSIPPPTSDKGRTSVGVRDNLFGYVSPAPSTPFVGGVGGGGNVNDDSPSTKIWSSKERIKAATCVAFSPDGKWLAVGESGYNPRVLIFSLAPDASSDLPVAAMAEHTFGVRKVAFSPCSRYLASIGTINDGFVYIWSLTTARTTTVRLHSSNKCTSVVKDMAWMGRNLITVGTRHVKVWRNEEEPRPHSPGARVLHGRNAVLGALSDAVMTCVVGISDTRAMVCSEKGDICMLDEDGQRLAKVADAEFGVSCIAVDADYQTAWIAGRNGNIRAFVIKAMMPSTPPLSPSTSRSSSPVVPEGCKTANVVALASMFGHLFTLDSNHSIKIMSMKPLGGVLLPDITVRELPAHKDAVMGIRLVPPTSNLDAAFYTWSAGGMVIFWDMQGVMKGQFEVELEQPADLNDELLLNELKVVRVSKRGDFFVSGDKYGVLRVIDGIDRSIQYIVKAHGSEIMDAVLYEDDEITAIVTCGRDRAVQVFTKVAGSWTLAQTLEDHTACVGQVLLLDGCNKLISCSTDRTIVMRDLVRREGIPSIAYVPSRIQNLKTSPIHMTPISDDSSTLYVATIDKQIQKYDVETGKTLQSFRAADDNGEAVVMDALVLGKDRQMASRPRFIAGIATSDKSIRLYDMNGTLIDKEWGHTEGVTDIVLLENDDDANSILISTGTDGTIMFWEFIQKPAKRSDSDSEDGAPKPTPKEVTASRAPIRRVLSKQELLDGGASPRTPIGTPLPKEEGKDYLGGASTPVNGRSPPRTLKKKTSAMSIKGKSSRVSNIGFGTPTPVQSDKNVQMGGGIGSLAPEIGIRRSSRNKTSTPPEDIPPIPPRKSSYTNDTQSTRSIKSTRKDREDPNLTLDALAGNLSRNLRAFRKKVENSQDTPRSDVLRDLEKELGLTRQVLTNGGTPKKDPAQDGIVAQLLDQYSDRLLDMLSAKLDDRLNLSVGGSSDSRRGSVATTEDDGQSISDMSVSGNGEDKY